MPSSASDMPCGSEWQRFSKRAALSEGVAGGVPAVLRRRLCRLSSPGPPVCSLRAFAQPVVEALQRVFDEFI